MAKSSKGHFVWYEHLTRDVQAAIAFYGEVVGWKTRARVGTDVAGQALPRAGRGRSHPRGGDLRHRVPDVAGACEPA